MSRDRTAEATGYGPTMNAAFDAAVDAAVDKLNLSVYRSVEIGIGVPTRVTVEESNSDMVPRSYGITTKVRVIEEDE